MNLAAGARGDLSRLVGRLESVRASLRKNLRSELVDEFARIVEALGYVDARALDVAKVPFGRLVAESIRFSRKLQAAGRANAATLTTPESSSRTTDSRPGPAPTSSPRSSSLRGMRRSTKT